MILYVDTSALVKKYVREAPSEQVLALITGFEAVATAALTYVEMAAALAKAGRQGWVDDIALQEAWRDFLAHWPAYTRLPVSSSVVERAADLAWKHGLRSYESLHLSCAQIWREATGEETVFACFDQRLARAASAEGLQVWPAAGA